MPVPGRRSRLYLAWVRNDSDGFVVNTERHPSSAYLILHRVRSA
jgi:hypothetical protein